MIVGIGGTQTKILKSNVSYVYIQHSVLALIKLSYFIHDCHNFCHIIYIKFSRCCLENDCWVAKKGVQIQFFVEKRKFLLNFSFSERCCVYSMIRFDDGKC